MSELIPEHCHCLAVILKAEPKNPCAKHYRPQFDQGLAFDTFPFPRHLITPSFRRRRQRGDIPREAVSVILARPVPASPGDVSLALDMTANWWVALP